MVTISREIRISASPGAVWSALATPSQQPVIEPRVRLVGEWGEPGTVGSGCELAMSGRPTMRMSVTEAAPDELHVVSIEWKGRTRGVQEARLRSVSAGCILTYTMSIEVPLVLVPVQRIFGNRQLVHWLDAVARVTAASDGRQE